MQPSLPYRIAKRLLDFAVSAFLLLLLSPLLLLLWCLIRLRMGSPAVFTQERAGLHGEPFRIRKFRTMTNEVDEEGKLLPDVARLKGLGISMRKSSLDELPQLLNVLSGDMSLVGPRPLYLKYIPLYSPEQRSRLDVKPGVTGLAQINGRNAITWEDKFQWDAKYAREAGFWLDLSILFKTFLHVVRPEGISQPGHATAEEFRGSPKDLSHGH